MIRFVFLGGVALVAASLVIGLVLSGGPFEGRAERYDRERRDNLMTLARNLRCDTNDLTQSPTLWEVSVCAGQHTENYLRDPETHVYYDFRRINANRFEICTTLTSRRYQAEISQGRLPDKDGKWCVEGRF